MKLFKTYTIEIIYEYGNRFGIELHGGAGSPRGYGQVPRKRKSTSIQFSLYKMNNPTPSQLVADKDNNLFAHLQKWSYLQPHIDWLTDDYKWIWLFISYCGSRL